MKSRILQPNNLTALITVLVVSLAYASTQMLTINGSDSDFAIDTGEFQVGLAEWGTVHHTGYPLYMLLGSPFVTALAFLGVPPSAGASLYSMLWALLAVFGAARIIAHFNDNPLLTIIGALTFGLTASMWIHASLAEVYSLSMAIIVLILGLTLKLLDGWDARLGWLLAFAGGLGVAHHRLIAIMLPMVGLLLLPVLLKSNHRATSFKWLLIALGCFALGFLPYLDMPLRVWLGSTWNYGTPATWDGFWYIFFGTEVKDWQKPVFDLGSILINLRDIVFVLADELTWPGLLAASLGLGGSIWNPTTRPGGRLLAGIALSLILFSALTRKAVLLQANLMPVVLCLMLGFAWGVMALIQKVSERSQRANQLIYAALFIWPLALFLIHRPTVLTLTQNPSGVNYINLIEKLLDAPPDSVVMAPWGWRYFALSYAKRVEGRLSSWTIVDHRADFATLTQTSGRAYTAADSFYIFTAAEFWEPRLGGAYLSSAGPGLVEISRQPTLLAPETPVVELGDGLALVDLKVAPLDTPDQINVTVWWTATSQPSRDYSTFVHVSDAEAISSNDDLVGQSDHIAPVYAWYATSLWSPGELVRDDHALTLLPDRPPKLIVVGMYHVDEGGNFINLGQINYRYLNGQWVMRP